MKASSKKRSAKFEPSPLFIKGGFSGAINVCNAYCIMGWVKEDNNPHPLTIDIIVNGDPILENIVSSQYLGETISSGTCNGPYAFNCCDIRWPSSISTSLPITIEIRCRSDNSIILRHIQTKFAFPRDWTSPVTMNNVVQKPTSDLANLERPPFYRGEVTTIAGSIITGWALSTDNPLRPVHLDLFLAGVFLARLITGETHQHVAHTIRLPVKSGFSFDLQRVTDDRARQTLAALRATNNATVPLELLIDVRIQGTDQSLPFSDQVRSVASSTLDISKIFMNIIGREVEIFSDGRNFRRSSYIETFLAEFPINTDVEKNDARVIAYYLPQFHPFPENDEWWGPGFTEWTNVSSAKALFQGHHQPHLPGDLGYYDLRIEQVQRDQIALAKKYRISGFCYYYYWFSGRTLMTLPIDRHIDQNLDIDFCLCWANESWSRRWDGSENDVLVAQHHTYDSDVEFIYSCLPYFRSPRYIKVNGAPLLQIYRVMLMERPRETIERWREIVRADGFPDLHVCMVESFGLTDPFEYGCDSSCQFPPHGVVGDSINLEIKDLDPHFTGTIYSYGEIVRSEIARPNAPHTWFRTAMPSWDNTARKGVAGNVFAGATPAMFETWMRFLVADARRRLPEGQRLIFVNAWNEWAEGTHLEPDRHYGHANLRAVRNALAIEAHALAPLLPPTDGTEDRLADTRRYVASLITTNRELTWLVSQPKGGLRIREENHFVSVSQKVLNVEVAENILFNIDSLNGRNVPRSAIIPLSVSQGLGLRGWAVYPEKPASDIMVSLRSTNPTRDGLRYVISIDYSEPREDVVAALGLNQSMLQNGFVLRASLQAVIPGQYELELVFPDAFGVSATSGRVVHTDIFVLVG